MMALAALFILLYTALAVPCDIIVNTEQDLRALAGVTDGVVCLGSNITLTEPWTPLPEFSGSFLGNTNIISNIQLVPTAEGTDIGFFSTLKDATIQDLILSFNTNLSITQSEHEYNIGELAGKVIGESTLVSNVNISGNISIKSATHALTVGGLVGRVTATEPVFHEINMTNNLLVDTSETEEEGLRLWVGGAFGYVSCSEESADTTQFSRIQMNSDMNINVGRALRLEFGGLAGNITARALTDIDLWLETRITTSATSLYAGNLGGIVNVRDISQIDIKCSVNWSSEVNSGNKLGLFAGKLTADKTSDVRIFNEKTYVVNKPKAISAFAQLAQCDDIRHVTIIIDEIVVLGILEGFAGVLTASTIDDIYIEINRLDGNGLIGFARENSSESGKLVEIHEVGIVLKIVQLTEEIENNVLFMSNMDGVHVKDCFVNIKSLKNLIAPTDTNLCFFSNTIRNSKIESSYVNVNDVNLSNISIYGFAHTVEDSTVANSFVFVNNLKATYNNPSDNGYGIALFSSTVTSSGQAMDATATSISGVNVQMKNISINNVLETPIDISLFIKELRGNSSVENCSLQNETISIDGNTAISGFVKDVTGLIGFPSIRNNLQTLIMDEVLFVESSVQGAVLEGNYAICATTCTPMYVTYISNDESFDRESYPSLFEENTSWDISDGTRPYLKYLPRVDLTTDVEYLPPEANYFWDFENVWELFKNELLPYATPFTKNAIYSTACTDSNCAKCFNKHVVECSQCSDGFVLTVLNETDPKVTKCINCVTEDANCVTCSNEDPLRCYMCRQDFYSDYTDAEYELGHCRECPKEVSPNGLCVSCNSLDTPVEHCDYCTTSGCVKCLAGFFPDGQQCKACPSPAVGTVECNECPDDGSVDEHCWTCSNEGNCSYCNEGYFLGADNTCSTCPEGMGTSLCLSCDQSLAPERNFEGCYVCTEDEGEHVCYQCMDGYSSDRKGGCSKNNDTASIAIICSFVILIVVIIVAAVVLSVIKGKREERDAEPLMTQVEPTTTAQSSEQYSN